MQNLLFTFDVVAPVFLIIFLGLFLKKKRWIDQNFVAMSSRLVFSVTLPALIFSEISATDFNITFDLNVILLIYLSTIAIFLLSWLISLGLSKRGVDQAVFIQGSFRSNFAIIGFALLSNLKGEQVLTKAAIILAFVMPLYNVLSILALTLPVRKERKLSYGRMLHEIVTNPLIIAIIAAIPFSYFRIKLPGFIDTTIEYLATLTLPLALLGIGGALNFASIKKDYRLTLVATLIKIVLLPASLTFAAFQLGIVGEDIIVLFMLFATPTAVVSYIMAEAMGCNSELAGNIIVMTTLGSIFTISLGIFILKSLGVI